jgi:hypothetical protein
MFLGSGGGGGGGGGGTEEGKSGENRVLKSAKSDAANAFLGKGLSAKEPSIKPAIASPEASVRGP